MVRRDNCSIDVQTILVGGYYEIHGRTLGQSQQGTCALSLFRNGNNLDVDSTTLYPTKWSTTRVIYRDYFKSSGPQ